MAEKNTDALPSLMEEAKMEYEAEQEERKRLVEKRIEETKQRIEKWLSNTVFQRFPVEFIKVNQNGALIEMGGVRMAVINDTYGYRLRPIYRCEICGEEFISNRTIHNPADVYRFYKVERETICSGCRHKQWEEDWKTKGERDLRYHLTRILEIMGVMQ